MSTPGKRLPNSLGFFVLCILFIPLLGCGGTVDANVTTHHNNNFRTGAYLAETTLTPYNVRTRGMERMYCTGANTQYPNSYNPCNPVTDGWILTQPLFVRNVDYQMIDGNGRSFSLGVANGVFVATNTNKVYALYPET
jgi:hypothetical protein